MRKVKCDKTAPVCASCRRSRLDCVYKGPAPERGSKRRAGDDVLKKLARYERILKEHGLLDVEGGGDGVASCLENPPREPISLHWNEPSSSRPGKLLTDNGGSRFVDNSLWRSLDVDEMQTMPDEESVVPEETDNRAVTDGMIGTPSDPLTDAFLAPSTPKLPRHHTRHGAAMLLWGVYAERVEPLCKILHVPSTARTAEAVSKSPSTGSAADNCLMSAIYHFAVFATTDEECVEILDQPRTVMLQHYHRETRQALVDASFLKTTKLPVLQAFVLFLMAARSTYDSHTFWVLTGVAVRMAQRMGLHRDGEGLGLPPFEVQVRRRLFYQLLPLEGNATQMVGAGISIRPDAWDTKLPLNIDDDAMWPDMQGTPEEQGRATGMMFCLSRACIGKYFAMAGQAGKSAGEKTQHHFKDYNEAEAVIGEAEREVEDKFIRYCDVTDPLHFLTVCLARSGIMSMRMRIRLPKLRDKSATDSERRELLRLANKILDTDAALFSHQGLQKFQWFTRPFCLWGTWDSLIVLLTTVWKRADLLSHAERTEAWARVEQVYGNHSDVLESRRTLHVAFGRLTLAAWDAHRNNDTLDPAFIRGIRQRGQPAQDATLSDIVDKGDEQFALDDWIVWDQLI